MHSVVAFKGVNPRAFAEALKETNRKEIIEKFQTEANQIIEAIVRKTLS